MVFDSREFLAFFAIFFTVYHLLSRSLQLQNVWILLGSCVFYGWWDWRFLALLFVAAGIDFAAGLALDASQEAARRKKILAISMLANLGILFTFKYFDFFSESFVRGAELLGLQVSPVLLHVALPVGVSFYTFQSMSYTIDIYRGHAKAERNPITYFGFVSFFPHMVAGPIQRSSHLLAQLNRPRSLTANDVNEGVWLLVYGFFLKEAIADPLSTLVEIAFTPDQASGWLTVLGTVAFGLQIYCDFNAYSIIARGLGRLLGIEFIWNFNQPYFSTSVQEFWRRWHISLSTWLRDYLYIPLGGNRGGHGRAYLNLLITMTLGGLWHGAAWTFVLWGVLHGVALAVHRAWRATTREKVHLPGALAWFMTMTVVFSGWFLFRCRDMDMVAGMLSSLTDWQWSNHTASFARSLALLTLPVAAIEAWQHTKHDLLAPLHATRWKYVAVSGTMLFMTILMFGRFKYEFIYFQF